MRQLVSIVIASVVHNVSSEASQLALDVLVCVGGRVDTTGRRRLQPNAYLEEVRSDDKKATMLLRLSAHMSAASTLEYVNATSRLFPLLLYILEETSTASSLRQSKFPSRFYVVRALELLSKLILVPENLVTVCRSPDSLLRALVDLLCVSTSSLEPIVPESSALAGDPAGRLRPPAVLLTSSSSGAGGVSMGSSFNAQAAVQATSSYFHQEHCDLELRDLSMDCLHSLCAVSVAMQLRLADIPDAVQLIYRIANLSATATVSGVGSSSTNTFSRTEGTSKAALVLALLFAQPELRSKYFSIRTNLIVSACSDETLSDVVCNKVNPLFHRPSLLQQTLLPPLDVSDTQSSAMVM